MRNFKSIEFISIQNFIFIIIIMRGCDKYDFSKLVYLDLLVSKYRVFQITVELRYY